MKGDHQMIEGTIKTAGGATVSWFGTIGSVLTATHEVLNIACVCVSICAGIYAVMVARATIRSRKIENVKNEVKICRDCKSGNPPPSCPFDNDERPADCPKNNPTK